MQLHRKLGNIGKWLSWWELVELLEVPIYFDGKVSLAEMASNPIYVSERLGIFEGKHPLPTALGFVVHSRS